MLKKMANGFKRFSTVEIGSVYNKPADIVRLASDWAEYVKQGGIFCKSGACPFVPGEKFDYDLTNFLYYRARAITADIPNANGDRFPHPELRLSYDTFVGKGVYFNHDSAKPEKAFGIILDAVYTPVHFGSEEYPDKYVELLCAIDRKAINTMRPGLLGDIESGKVTSTSMGTIAAKAQCSICGNIATNMEQLCFVPGTAITLSDGSVKPIEDIAVGDEVLDHQGRVQTVTHTFERETHETVYEFKVMGLRYPITCTGNHPLYALRNVAGQTNRRGSVLLPPDFVHAHALAAGDFLFSPVPHYKSEGIITPDEAEGHIESRDALKISALDANKLSASFGKDLVQPKKCNKLYAIPYAGGFVREIQSITPVPYLGKVYNFETTESHTYIAGGVAVHNCLHVHPQSPLYCKGRDVYGKRCYEDNFGLTFLEDSIVYVPADATARMLEVYASKHDMSLNRMAELFEKYSTASGRPMKRNAIELTSTFQTTGGFMPTAAPKPSAQPAPGQPVVSPYQAAVGELNTEVPEATQKLFETKMRRIIEEELRKMYGPALEQMDKSVRPQVKDLVGQEFEKVKGDIGEIVPGMDQAPAGPAAEEEKGQSKPAPAAPAVPAAPAIPVAPKAAMQYPLSFIEDFSSWTNEDRAKLIASITTGKTHEFKGVLEFPVKE